MYNDVAMYLQWHIMGYVRWDSNVADSVYLEKEKRTLDSILEDSKTKEFTCKYPPLLEIETDHIIPDELHLLLRITDVLIENLIATAIKENMKIKWNFKDGPMIKAIIVTVRSCGIPFNIWKNKESKAATYAYTSLVGNKKRICLNFYHVN